MAAPMSAAARSRTESPRALAVALALECPTSSNIIDTVIMAATIDKMQGEYACLYTKTLKAKNVLEGTQTGGNYSYM